MLCSMRTIVLLRTFEMFQFDQIYGTHVRGLINKQLVKCTYNGVKRYNICIPNSIVVE